MKHKGRILVIDDEPAILEVIKIVLDEEGYEVQTTTDARSALKLTAPLPDIILLDVLLSGKDGRVIGKRLKSQKNTMHIPIIMLSALSTDGKTITQDMADTFIKKPFDIDVLVDTVKKYIKKS